MTTFLDSDARRRLDRLTRRELEVLSQMAQGKSNSGIARALCVTEHSIEKYVSTILVKLDVASASDIHRRVKAVLLYLAVTSTILQDHGL